MVKVVLPSLRYPTAILTDTSTQRIQLISVSVGTCIYSEAWSKNLHFGTQVAIPSISCGAFLSRGVRDSRTASFPEYRLKAG